jgi:hypothetical protein
VRRLIALAIVAIGCGGGATTNTPVLPPVPKSTLDDAGWGKFHSARHAVMLPLPDGRAWKIDDHTRPELVAVHAGSGSRVTLRLVQDAGELTNRQKCEEKALQEKFVKDLRVSVVEEQEGIDKDGWDAHVLVAVEKTPTELVGHVLSFSSFIRKCLWFHFETHAKDGLEFELSERLALARTKVLGELSLDSFGAVPRQRPEK